VENLETARDKLRDELKTLKTALQMEANKQLDTLRE
jgi:hypothetical protein